MGNTIPYVLLSSLKSKNVAFPFRHANNATSVDTYHLQTLSVLMFSKNTST